jgi:hypothetical protein
MDERKNGSPPKNAAGQRRNHHATPSGKHAEMPYLRLIFASSLFAGQSLSFAADNPAGMAFFEANIRPLLVERCYECHSSEKGQSKGGLTLDTRAGWLAGGEPNTGSGRYSDLADTKIDALGLIW